MVNDSEIQPEDEVVWVARLVPDGREGKKVFARSLRPGEVDTGEVVHVEAGEELVIRAGGLSIGSDEIDADSPVGMGGYAPVANTIWTIHQFMGEQLGYYLFIFALARRLDAAHRSWSEAMKDRHAAVSQDGVDRRNAMFNALATAEMAVVALHRASSMAVTLIEKHCSDLCLPDALRRIQPALKDMRDAFEHIDERAEGKVGMNQKLDPGALSIFDQPDFIGSAILRYKEHTLDYDQDFLAALLACRKLVLDSLDSRVRQRFVSQTGYQ